MSGVSSCTTGIHISKYVLGGTYNTLRSNEFKCR